ncbi:hypothetical protein ACOZFM_28705 [Streptomyces arboris]|uniref:hypothetical protein n=1 Tax=Streptomyces arboris TaxID=2600619 RepID=UPI003BF48DF6
MRCDEARPSHAAHDRLTADQIAACAGRALSWPEEDVAAALVTHLGRVLAHDHSGGALLLLLADALRHVSPAVQEQALALASQHVERVDGRSRRVPGLLYVPAAGPAHRRPAPEGLEILDRIPRRTARGW